MTYGSHIRTVKVVINTCIKIVCLYHIHSGATLLRILRKRGCFVQKKSLVRKKRMVNYSTIYHDIGIPWIEELEEVALVSVGQVMLITNFSLTFMSHSIKRRANRRRKRGDMHVIQQPLCSPLLTYFNQNPSIHLFFDIPSLIPLFCLIMLTSLPLQDPLFCGSLFHVN